MKKETDSELLELAAKAAGWSNFDWLAGDGYMNVYDAQGNQSAWNPLTGDGDALRLLNSLELELRHVHGAAHAGLPGRFWCTEQWFPAGDKNAATRLAIVRAAAEIGRAMP